jgi:hypothetical protein
VSAALPLKVGGRVVGLLTLFELLPQKCGALSTLDHELLDLLATHTGTALFCASLAERLGLERTPEVVGA